MKYLSLYLLELKSILHFRMNLYSWLLSQPLQIVIIYWIWSGVFSFTDSFVGMSLNEVLAYYFIIHFITCVLSSAFSVNYLVWNDINEGDLDRYICRPINYLSAMTFKSLAEPTVELVIAIPTLVFSLFFVGFVTSIASAFAFTFSLILALLIVLEIQKLIGLMTFLFEKIFAIRDIIFSVFMLMSGQLIPIVALPDWIKVVSTYLPFEAVYHIPTMILMDDTVILSNLIIKQILWFIFLKLVVQLSWQRGIHRYASQGG